MCWIVGVVGVLALAGIFCKAQESNKEAIKTRLDQVVKSYTTDNAFMGAVLVADGDQVLLNKGYGMANLEWNIPNAPDVKFRIGSLTKQFTGALVLLLEQEGKLKIDDPVSKYLPDTPKTWEKITLRNLLQHRSGIPNFSDASDFRVWSLSPHTSAEVLARIRDLPLDFEPGAKAAYSNSNFEVLGAVIERVSGKKYGELLSKRILAPVG